ncbi:hypothetical protein ACOMHN_060799 [Nucella lapillus]
MDNDMNMDNCRDQSSRDKRSRSTQYEESTKRRRKDRPRSRSPKYSGHSTRNDQEDGKHGISMDWGNSDDSHRPPQAPSSHTGKIKMYSSKEDSGYGDELENHSARNYPGHPLQNQFQNDGSFLEVFRQRMEAASTVQQAADAAQQLGETSVGAAADPYTSNLPATANEPFVMKRRLSKPLKTGMVQKPKKRVDACDPQAKAKDSWSMYMKEVQKYRANKCVNNELACRPLMK